MPTVRTNEIAVAGAAAASLGVLALGGHGGPSAALVLAGTALACWSATAKHRAPSTVAIAIAVAVLAVASVARDLIGSHDLWSYAMYGRIVAFHAADPYRVAPAAYPNDPVLAQVGVGWRHTTSAYGPLFVAYAAAVARVCGTHLLALRLAFQASAALAVAGCLAILARVVPRDERARALALVGLQPVVWCAVVNGGHNDALVALAVTAAVALAARGRWRAAGVAVALGALVKVVALLALPVLIVVALRRGWRAAARVGGTAVIAFGAATLIAPRSLLAAPAATHGIVSRAAPWRILVLSHLLASVRATQLGLAALVAVAAVATWYARRCSPDGPGVALLVAIAIGGAPIVAGYSLPWYGMWALPAAALALASRSRRVAWLVAAHAGGLSAVYVAGTATTAGHALGGALSLLVPGAATAGLLFALAGARPGRNRTDRPSPTAVATATR